MTDNMKEELFSKNLPRPCIKGVRFDHNFFPIDFTEKRDLYRCTICGLEKVILPENQQNRVLYNEPNTEASHDN